jgi:hypothetical protein
MDDHRTTASEASAPPPMNAAEIVENLLDGGEPLDPKDVLAGMQERNPKYAFVNWADLDEFTRQYLETAFWTDEERLKEEAVENGLDPKTHDFEWSAEALQQAQEDCEQFRAKAGELLAQAGDDEQNAHDFWLTRNGHGAGFWDRGYPDEIGDGLSDISKEFGEKYTYLADDGEIHFM